jgi:hypothetical protein
LYNRKTKFDNSVYVAPGHTALKEEAFMAVIVIEHSAKAAPSDSVRATLRLEGLVLFLAAAALYARSGESWRLFAILFLAPDLSMLGYLFGPRIGATFYNTAHSTIGALAIAAAGSIAAQPLVTAIALVWLAHVGFDRALGYGLKYASGFRDTHLGRIGRHS